jgi:hypothetical protein
MLGSRRHRALSPGEAPELLFDLTSYDPEVDDEDQEVVWVANVRFTLGAPAGPAPPVASPATVEELPAAEPVEDVPLYVSEPRADTPSPVHVEAAQPQPVLLPRPTEAAVRKARRVSKYTRPIERLRHLPISAVNRSPLICHHYKQSRRRRGNMLRLK